MCFMAEQEFEFSSLCALKFQHLSLCITLTVLMKQAVEQNLVWQHTVVKLTTTVCVVVLSLSLACSLTCRSVEMTEETDLMGPESQKPIWANPLQDTIHRNTSQPLA